LLFFEVSEIPLRLDFPDELNNDSDRAEAPEELI
jgi:hypothetical protein